MVIISERFVYGYHGGNNGGRYAGVLLDSLPKAYTLATGWRQKGDIGPSTGFGNL